MWERDISKYGGWNYDCCGIPVDEPHQGELWFWAVVFTIAKNVGALRKWEDDEVSS